ncbi:deoxyribodipyrimidine photo-lyase [Vallicoccus soli]|uniref:Deoxyribodipyrimidine photo-lyase n=2 Tax=Vallicoccus soli TaxID=2339232 RepID=A0A3A3Z4D2_9ACTN|nr:deoxyribodipyrimidine photo-lyase [Vallicoccus soli]
MWFRRDLRLADNPALLAAAEADEVVPLFVVDPRLWGTSGAPRRAYLARSLDALRERTGLVVRRGDPAEEVVRAARAAGAESVHAAADTGVYGRERDGRVERALADAGVPLVRTGSPYAVAPGRVRKPDGSPYRVYSPFYRAWRQVGWHAPAGSPRDVRWVRPLEDQGVPDVPDLGATHLPPAGEEAARRRWRAFRDERLHGYAGTRNRPDLSGTSRLSVHLKYGELHPRTVLADLGDDEGEGAESYRKELAWRDFYADVLWEEPRTAREAYRPEMARMRQDEAGALLDAWRAGRTGFPFVDAGMRQLLTEGWVHNRVRMVVASFLCKDLHLDWRLGARHFMQHLVDGDLASNNHGWQWVAGTGTDAAPYFRVFNPVTQGRQHDPDGDYVRRYVEELRDVPGGAVHEPWTLPGGLPTGYPERVVDHGEERKEALRRYQEVAG